MAEAAPISASRVRQLASRQLADFDARDPGTLFAEGVLLNVDQGYALQAAVAELRRNRGERIIGYKVGCTSPTIRAQLGIDHRVAGRLFDTERFASGAQLSRADFANLAIEGELAIELSREPIENDFSGSQLPACVARVIPVVELHHHKLRGEAPSAGELIAHNAIHAGFVAGSGAASSDVGREGALSIFVDDRLLGECAGHALIETIRGSLKWLAEFVRRRGESLTAGQIVLTGSIPSLIPIEKACRIRVEAPPFGSVTARIK